MNKILISIALLNCAVSGCVAPSLGRHTVNQIQSASEYRYQAALHALAMVAADPGTVPSYALLSSGIDSVTNTGVANAATTWSWAPEVLFKSEVIGFTSAHSPQMSWTVSPVADYTQLGALRSACMWVLVGPNQLDEKSLGILTNPECDLSPGPHFGVIDQLAQLPPGWLHVGRRCDIPRNACYRDHVGSTWVWVMPDGIDGLIRFTLVLQDIATLAYGPLDGSVPANRRPPTLVTLWVIENTKQVTDKAAKKVTDKSTKKDEATAPDLGYSKTAVFRVDRVIKPECQDLIQQQINEALAKNQVGNVQISWEQWMQWTDPYQGQRVAVKPGSATANAISPPKDRPIPTERDFERVLLGPEITSGTLRPLPEAGPPPPDGTPVDRPTH